MGGGLPSFGEKKERILQEKERKQRTQGRDDGCVRGESERTPQDGASTPMHSSKSKRISISIDKENGLYPAPSPYVHRTESVCRYSTVYDCTDVLTFLNK